MVGHGTGGKAEVRRPRRGRNLWWRRLNPSSFSF